VGLPDPATDSAATLRDLAAHLNRPAQITNSLGGHVWHCAIRAAPGDPHLTDPEWADIATAIVDAAGVAPLGDDHACRWVAIRHAPDHIHIVATLTRRDRKKPNLRGNWYTMRAAVGRMELKYGLARTRPLT
jgi:hypothetical protein